MQDAHLAFKEMVRILKPGGKLFLLVHLRKSRALMDTGHRMWFTEKFIKKLLSANNLKVTYSEITDRQDLAWGARRAYIGVFEKI